jgi:hypothetical protein
VLLIAIASQFPDESHLTTVETFPLPFSGQSKGFMEFNVVPLNADIIRPVDLMVGAVFLNNFLSMLLTVRHMSALQRPSSHCVLLSNLLGVVTYGLLYFELMPVVHSPVFLRPIPLARMANWAAGVPLMMCLIHGLAGDSRQAWISVSTITISTWLGVLASIIPRQYTAVSCVLLTVSFATFPHIFKDYFRIRQIAQASLYSHSPRARGPNSHHFRRPLWTRTTTWGAFSRPPCNTHLISWRFAR